VIVSITFLVFFPFFHLTPLPPASTDPGRIASTQAVAVFAEKFWTERLLVSRDRASDAAVVAAAIVKDPASAVKTYGHEAGIGGMAYYYLKGVGRVVEVERNRLRLALEGSGSPEIELQTGNIFGNAVRDGTGLITINDLPSLQDYNTLAAELDQRVETRILPVLRKLTGPGARVEFVGCAEAREPIAGQPDLSLVPIFAEVK
jgi:predicted lipoprotein